MVHSGCSHCHYIAYRTLEYQYDCSAVAIAEIISEVLCLFCRAVPLSNTFSQKDVGRFFFLESKCFGS